MKRSGNLTVNDLGFETKASLISALRVSGAQFDHAIEACEKGDPYERWYEPKRSGGQRLIENPTEPLKTIQRRINRMMQRLRLPGVFHGSFEATSILSNAKPHSAVTWYFGFDLANYYKTIRPEKVYSSLRCLRTAPDIARLLTRLTTIGGHVPQGAPTSPMIAAIVMLNLAGRLTNLCEKLGARVTIYGDNICISGPRSIAHCREAFLSIAKTEGFRIRASKTRLVSPSQDKPLPGLVVRRGVPTVYDDTRVRVNALVKKCVEIGEGGLARSVCVRYANRVRGLVNHYAWIDAVAMAESIQSFNAIQWPNEFDRDPCWSPMCRCSVELTQELPAYADEYALRAG